MKPFQIFKPGTHTAMNGRAIAFSEADLAAVARTYDPALHEAPIVVGHPRADAPAYGWVEGLAFDDGGLTATPGQVDADFAGLVAAGRFKKVSASFYTPQAPNNPAPGGYYLRHVGFLGAQPPAVKGLKPIEFSEAEEGVVTVEFGDLPAGAVARILRTLRDFLIAEFGQDKADQALPPYDVDYVQEEAARPPAADNRTAFTDPQHEERDMPPDSTTPGANAGKANADRANADKTAEIEARQAELDRQAEELKAREAEFAESQARARRQANDAFVDAIVAEGRLAPGRKAAILDFMDRLDAGDTVEFGEGEGRTSATPLDFFKTLLKEAPKAIDFTERSGAANDGRGGGGELDSDDPQAIADAAAAYVEEQKAKGRIVDVATAVRAVTPKETDQ